MLHYFQQGLWGKKHRVSAPAIVLSETFSRKDVACDVNFLGPLGSSDFLPCHTPITHHATAGPEAQNFMFVTLAGNRQINEGTVIEMAGLCINLGGSSPKIVAHEVMKP